MPIKTKSVSTILSKCLNLKFINLQKLPNRRILIATIKKEKPDLVILEVNLNEVDGIDVCTDLRSDVTFAKLPIIFVSNNADDFTQIDPFHAGADEFIPKTSRSKSIANRVNESGFAQMLPKRRNAKRN